MFTKMDWNGQKITKTDKDTHVRIRTIIIFLIDCATIHVRGAQNTQNTDCNGQKWTKTDFFKRQKPTD